MPDPSAAAREAARDLYYKTGALVIPPGDHDFIEVASRALDAFAAARVVEERERHPETAVRRFHDAFAVKLGGSWTDEDRRGLRMRLLEEEFIEYLAAEYANDAPGTLDALVDMTYVIIGAALEYGWDFAGAFAAVHAANMAKLGPDGRPITRADGKVMKPEGWRPADLTPFLAAALRAPRGSGGSFVMANARAHGHQHAEAFCQMLYRCAVSASEAAARRRKLEQITIATSPAKMRAVMAASTQGGCGHEEVVWNSRDGVTPFAIACRGCGGEAHHAEWSRDVYNPEYRPRRGERIFRDGTPDEARAIMRRRLEMGRGTDYEVPESEWSEYIEAAASEETGEFQPGWPSLRAPDGEVTP